MVHLFGCVFLVLREAKREKTKSIFGGFLKQGQTPGPHASLAGGKFEATFSSFAGHPNSAGKFMSTSCRAAEVVQPKTAHLSKTGF